MNNHPIDPTTPRGGYLATIVLTTGTKRTRYFVGPEEAYTWVSLQERYGVVRDSDVKEV